MRISHTAATVLIAGLLTQRAGFAQSVSDSADGVVTVPRQSAMHQLFDALMQAKPGKRVRFEIVGGKILEGDLVESGADDVTIAVASGGHKVIRLENIVGLRPREIYPGHTSNASAFGTGLTIGGGIALAWIITAVANSK